MYKKIKFNNELFTVRLSHTGFFFKPTLEIISESETSTPKYQLFGNIKSENVIYRVKSSDYHNLNRIFESDQSLLEIMQDIYDDKESKEDIVHDLDQLK